MLVASPVGLHAANMIPGTRTPSSIIDVINYMSASFPIICQYVCQEKDIVCDIE